jgi:predicted nucleotidyltransferase
LEDKTDKTELEQVVALLQSYDVEFIVIGGQAEILHGGSRITQDLDLCYRRTPENMKRLAEALKPMHPTLRGAAPGLPFILDAKTFEFGSNFTFETSIIDLDLLGYVEPLGGYDDLKKNAIVYHSLGLDIWTISLDDLLKIKLHINRPKDQESIAQLLALKRLRDENRSS